MHGRLLAPRSPCPGATAGGSKLASRCLVAAFTPATCRCRLPGPQDPELFKMQKTMAEAWTIVTEAYVDDSFNHTGERGGCVGRAGG